MRKTEKKISTKKSKKTPRQIQNKQQQKTQPKTKTDESKQNKQTVIESGFKVALQLNHIQDLFFRVKLLRKMFQNVLKII